LGGGQPAQRAKPEPQPPVTVGILVFAASSLTEALDELAAEFQQRHPGIAVTGHYAGSSTLTAQLKQGESADVFASANERQMQALVDAGLVRAGDPAVFAANRLVVITPAANPAGVRSWEDLGSLELALVLAAPGVPVRDYTDELVRKAAADPGFGPGFRDRFYANLVSEEANVRLSAAKVALGEADAAVVYSTDVTPDIAGRVRRFEIPDRFNVTARYPIAVLAGSPRAAPAAAFVRFVLGADGRAVLARRGFSLPPEVR
jgi:molybdate transport system substrate-binding protein